MSKARGNFDNLRIVLTNDDGVYAPGLRAMRRALKSLGEVTVVGPATEQSAAGHSITLLYPLVVQELHENGERIGFAVEGKPADCVKLGLVALLDQRPDLLISGINAGANAGINVLYSGTVAAAIEGAFCNVTAIAVSLDAPDERHYVRAAAIAIQVIQQILEHRPRTGELFNVNIPDLSDGDPIGVRVLPQALACYDEHFESRKDPRGRRYYWLLPDGLKAEDGVESDLEGLASRYVTVTPLCFDLTDYRRLESMKEWAWHLD